MKIKGIAWAGTKTENYKETKEFFENVLHLPILEDKGIVTIYKLLNGDIFELLSPEAAPEIGHPKGCKVDFLVDDVHKSVEELIAGGCDSVGTVYSEESQDWTNFRVPDGNLYGFTNMRFHPLSQPKLDRVLFYGPYEANAYLSNWYPAPIFLKDKIWPSTEHYYQSQKLAGTQYEEICRRMESPRLTFEFTRRSDIPVREDWDEVKVDIMREAVFAKFSQNPELKEKLLDTGDLEIVENSPVDNFWGIGKDRKGKNLLGKVLMEVRDKLREEK